VTAVRHIAQYLLTSLPCIVRQQRANLPERDSATASETRVVRSYARRLHAQGEPGKAAVIDLKGLDRRLGQLARQEPRSNESLHGNPPSRCHRRDNASPALISARHSQRTWRCNVQLRDMCNANSAGCGSGGCSSLVGPVCVRLKCLSRSCEPAALPTCGPSSFLPVSTPEPPLRSDCYQSCRIASHLYS
jgi:hypothetical protein